MKHEVLFVVCVLLVALVKAENTQFDYKKHGSDWSEQADQDTDWTQCSSQVQQSPIKLSYGVPVANNSYLFAKASPMPGKVSWFNTTVYIKATTLFGTLYSKAVNDELFALNATEVRVRCHAEHMIEDRYYDLQLQVFFISMYPSPKNTKVGLSLFFQRGTTADPVLQTIKNSYTAPGETANIKLDLSSLLNNLDQSNFWSYQGSSTIPPCFSGKTYWIITDKVSSMSQEQYNFFHDMFYTEEMDGNWRELQPVSDNPVNFYRA